jgi:D-3-phosphoglycerate dehydrogenase
MPTVLAIPSVLRDVSDTYQRTLQAAGLTVAWPPPGATLQDPEQLSAALRDVDAVIASVETYSRDILERSRLRVIARMGVGYDAVDVAAATRCGIVVTTTPGTNEHAVAETAIALLTGVYRGLPWRYQEVLTGKWSKRALPRLAGQTIGLVGLGRIGKAMVPRCQGLGLRVIACDPYPDHEFAAAHGVRLCTFDELLAEADIVSLHLPATAENTDLINARTLARMKRGSVLINTARGALVDEDALVEALRSGHLMAAGLDVFKKEPLPLDSPLLQLPNALLLPHIAGLDLQSQEAMATLAAQCIADLYQGRWPEHCIVNNELKGRWQW